MPKRLLPLALFAMTALLLCPKPTLAQTPPPPVPTVPSAPPAITPAKKHSRAGGKIASVDAAAKTITLTHGKKTVVLSVPDTAKIYKVGDPKGQPTGTFADLTVGATVNAALAGDDPTDAPVAKTIHLRAPKTAAP